MAKLAIGIDFGHSAVKLVEVRRGKQPQVKRAMLLPIPPGTIAGGVIQKPEVMAEVLHGISPLLRMDRAMVVAGIAGTQVHVLPVQIPDKPPAEIYPLVLQEFVSALRLSEEDMDLFYIDYAPLPPNSVTERDVLAVGIRRADALTFVDVLREAKMPAGVLDVQAFALPRIFPEEGRVCHIDIGAEQTQVLVVSDGEYVLYRLLPIGMRRFNAEVAKAYEISESEALALQKEKHIDMLMIQAPGQRTPMQATIDELVGGIIQTLEFLRARHRAVSIGELLPHAYLSGGGALQKGMDILLSEEIGINVTLSPVFAGCQGIENLPQEVLQVEPIFAGALGLALRGLSES